MAAQYQQTQNTNNNSNNIAKFMKNTQQFNNGYFQMQQHYDYDNTELYQGMQQNTGNDYIEEQEGLIILNHVNQLHNTQKPGLFNHHQRTSTASSTTSSTENLLHLHFHNKHSSYHQQNLSQSQILKQKQKQQLENSQKISSAKLSLLQISSSQLSSQQQLINSQTATNCTTQQNTHRGDRQTYNNTQNFNKKLLNQSDKQLQNKNVNEIKKNLQKKSIVTKENQYKSDFSQQQNRQSILQSHQNQLQQQQQFVNNQQIFQQQSYDIDSNYYSKSANILRQQLQGFGNTIARDTPAFNNTKIIINSSQDDVINLNDDDQLELLQIETQSNLNTRNIGHYYKSSSKASINDYDSLTKNMKQQHLSQIINQQQVTDDQQYFSLNQVQQQPCDNNNDASEFNDQQLIEGYNSIESNYISQSYDRRIQPLQISSKLQSLNSTQSYAKRDLNDIKYFRQDSSSKRNLQMYPKTNYKENDENPKRMARYWQNEMLHEYPNQLNLNQRFDCIAHDKHRKSLEDVIFTGQKVDVITETIDLRRDQNKSDKKNKQNNKKAKLTNNNSTLTKESLQQFLTKAKQNHEQFKHSHKQSQIPISKQQPQIPKQQATNNKKIVKGTYKNNYKKTIKNQHKQTVLISNIPNTNEEYQLSSNRQDQYTFSMRKPSISKALQLNSPYQNSKITSIQNQCKSVKKENLNEQALKLLLRKRNDSLHNAQSILQRNLSKEKLKANSLIRVDESQVNSFLCDSQFKQQRKTILKPNLNIVNKKSSVLQSHEKSKQPFQNKTNLVNMNSLQNKTVDLLSPKSNSSQFNFTEAINKASKLQQLQSPSTSAALIENIQYMKQAISPNMSRNHKPGLSINTQSCQRQTLDVNTFAKYQHQKLISNSQQQKLISHVSTHSFTINQDTSKILNQKQSPKDKHLLPTRNAQRLLSSETNSFHKIASLTGNLERLKSQTAKLQRKTCDVGETYGFYKVTEEDHNLQTEQSSGTYTAQKTQNQDPDRLRLQNKSKMQIQLQREQSVTKNHDQLQSCLSACKSPIAFKKQMHYNKPKQIQKDVSYLIRILYHVIKFTSIDTIIKIAHTSKKFSKIREVKFIINQQFKTLVVNGLSTFDRVRFWNYRTRFIFYRRKYKNLYHKLINEKTSEYHSDIQKDLDRTFPQLKHFTKGNLGQDQLERILTAISIYYKKLGYVQGMNFIAGTVLLSFQNEEDAFWMIISMLVNFKLDQLLTFESNRFRIICFQIDMFVKAYMPHLYDIFKQNDLSSEFYASQWLFTFFSIDLPFDIVYIAMDLFLIEGYCAFIRICLALLKLIENELFELSYDESLVFLKTFGRHLDTDSETFYHIAMSFKVSKQMCKDLEGYYKEHVLKKIEKQNEKDQKKNTNQISKENQDPKQQENKDLNQNNSENIDDSEYEMEIEFDYSIQKWYMVKRKIKQPQDNQSQNQSHNDSINQNNSQKDNSALSQIYDDSTGTHKNKDFKNKSNPIKSFGQRMLQWFKKDEKTLQIESNLKQQMGQNDKEDSEKIEQCIESVSEEDQPFKRSNSNKISHISNSDEILSDREDDAPRHHYGRISDAFIIGRQSAMATDDHPQSPNYFKITPNSKIIKGTGHSRHDSLVTKVSQRLESLNDSTLMLDVKEGPRLNIPHSWQNNNHSQSNKQNESSQQTNIPSHSSKQTMSYQSRKQSSHFTTGYTIQKQQQQNNLNENYISNFDVQTHFSKMSQKNPQKQ